MAMRQFNLVTDPWIKVIRAADYRSEEVSLQTLFQQSSDYLRLAGETQSQDLAIMRLLLAILHTVYSRFDATGEPYEWLTIDLESLQVAEAVEQDDYEPDDLFETWDALHQLGHFSAIVIEYLARYQDRFDFFGERPFYQATQSEYDVLVPEKKKVATGSGTVAIRQINRTISESGNSPALFAPRSDAGKDTLGMAELVRWVITYQNYTGVTDKTKIVAQENFSNDSGWLYRLSPVFAVGDTLFDTLLLNLILVQNEDAPYAVERPVWERPNAQRYVQDRERELQPDNLAALYTSWSRVLFLQWGDDRLENIFSAGVPPFSADNAFLEPMTTWRWIKKEQVYRPHRKAMTSVSKAMWRNFGEYVDLHDDSKRRQPGVVTWLQTLKARKSLPGETQITLATVALISDGNATSQAPAAEVADVMRVNADVLFDSMGAQYWPKRIEDAIESTDTAAKFYWIFVSTIAKLRNISGSTFAAAEQEKFYQDLTIPFDNWLRTLSINDDRDAKIGQWNAQVKKIVLSRAKGFMTSATPRDMAGLTDENGNETNIFIAYRQLLGRVSEQLGDRKGEVK